MARYLVTGGAGFIGSNLVERLIAQGASVRVLDDFSTGKRENLAPFMDQIELFEGSIEDFALTKRAAEGVDYILHQAALPSVPKSIQLPRETNNINIGGIVNLLVSARDAGVKRFVFAASSSAYGNTETLPKVETMPAQPLSPYAIQKLAGEMYCRVFFEQYGLQTVALRYFNIFGPRQDPTSFYSAVIPKFVTACLDDEAPTIYGDGETSRDFTFIDNVVQANLKACTAPDKCAGQVMNIACGGRVTLTQLANGIREALGRGKPPHYAEERAGDVKHSMADISRARELIGYDPTVGFEEGLAKTIAWYTAQAK
ncbi:MAG: SDR family oxidoreductase [Deltaproteobacteria bacterium]|nr:SDR family oxidoreductase [Deltaproteobacteria bacterium]